MFFISFFWRRFAAGIALELSTWCSRSAGRAQRRATQTFRRVLEFSRLCERIVTHWNGLESFNALNAEVIKPQWNKQVPPMPNVPRPPNGPSMTVLNSDPENKVAYVVPKVVKWWGGFWICQNKLWVSSCVLRRISLAKHLATIVWQTQNYSAVCLLLPYNVHEDIYEDIVRAT